MQKSPNLLHFSRMLAQPNFKFNYVCVYSVLIYSSYMYFSVVGAVYHFLGYLSLCYSAPSSDYIMTMSMTMLQADQAADI